MQRFTLLAAVVALVLSFAALYSSSSSKERPLHPVSEVHHTSGPVELELAVHMGRMQRYHHKLWLAGEAGNEELAHFYLHELEESMEEVAQARLVEDGVDISKHMATYGLATIRSLKEVMERDGVQALHGQSELLAKACTSCHLECQVPFLRIKVPMGAEFPGQDFLPVQ